MKLDRLSRQLTSYFVTVTNKLGIVVAGDFHRRDKLGIIDSLENVLGLGKR